MDNDEDWIDNIKGFYNKYGEWRGRWFISAEIGLMR